MAGAVAVAESKYGPVDFRKATKRSLDGPVRIEDLGYVPFPVKFLVLDFMIPCDLFVPVLAKGEEVPNFVKVLDRGQFFSEEWRFALHEQRVEMLYAEEGTAMDLDDYFAEVLHAFSEDEVTTASQKAQVVYNYGEFLARRVFQDVFDGQLFEKVNQWVESAVRLLEHEHAKASVIYRLFSRDYETFTHCVQVALMAAAFCGFCGRCSEDAGSVAVAGLYHDIGKIWVDQRILLKPTSLSREEFAHIRRHPQAAYDHLAAMDWMNADQLAAVLEHHESMDGTGYPRGLQGADIHPHARVLRICDCFDALTTDRPYKKAVTPYRALKLMQSEMRLSLDRHLLYKFIQFLGC